MTPAGFTAFPAAEVNDGPMTLDRQAKEELRPGARADLVAAGFVAGYVRSWVASSGRPVLVIGISQFATHQGAELYSRRFREPSRLVYNGAAAESPLPIPSIPGGSAFITVTGQPFERVVFTRDLYLVQMSLSDTSTSAEAVDRLAAEQWARLP